MAFSRINPQAKAVRCYLEPLLEQNLEEILDRLSIAEWYNGRERGYVLSYNPRVNEPKKKVRNVAWYEHRNSDIIVAVEFETDWNINPPTFADIPDGTYKDKWDVSYSVKHGQAYKMARWIQSKAIRALFHNHHFMQDHAALTQ